ncbi:hypothetical protein OPT61_g8563 [Boeremia exigua]|uniref:Uncharacterized protein n=1 Tax=Boeremia exigua TaxID=749465 RepID=A0ACC2HYB2_9PLEO|nr:hypothetical protein OPT61_g8563 [Boeremia exigua]
MPAPRVCEKVPYTFLEACKADDMFAEREHDAVSGGATPITEEVRFHFFNERMRGAELVLKKLYCLRRTSDEQGGRGLVKRSVARTEYLLRSCDDAGCLDHFPRGKTELDGTERLRCIELGDDV